MFYPRLVMAGTQSGVGKTTLSLALMAALARRGTPVQPFKVGPDYIDPTLHHRATGMLSCNLDAWLAAEEDIKSLFVSRAPVMESADAEAALSGVSVIEGVMGLYDGHANSAWASTAHAASLLKAPVLLVVNAQGMSLSAAALVSGFADFASRHKERPDLADLCIAGVLLNQAASERHYKILKNCIEENTGIPCLGYALRGGAPILPERHLGLVPAGELSDLDVFFQKLADMADACFDMEAILGLARSAPKLSPPRRPKLTPREDFSSLSIGVPKDEAFSFYYPENLEFLEDMGVRLVYFSPLRDSALPPYLDGVYLGGGFPEVYVQALEANVSFRTTLAAALEGGLPAYAECGGMMYLCSSLHGAPAFSYRHGQSEGRFFSMTGFFEERARMTDRLQPFGYVNITLLRDCVLGKKGDSYHAHEFHYARLEGHGSEPLFRIEKADGRSWTGGLCRKNVAGGFPHAYFWGCPEIAMNFLSSCLRVKAAGGRAR